MEKRILFLLILSLTGILLLATLNLIIPPKETTIKNLLENKNSYANKEIQLEANIIKVTDFPKSSFQILILEDKTGNITATSNSPRQLNINKSKSYIITGKLQEYKNETQVSIDRIEEK